MEYLKLSIKSMISQYIKCTNMEEIMKIYSKKNEENNKNSNTEDKDKNKQYKTDNMINTQIFKLITKIFELEKYEDKNTLEQKYNVIIKRIYGLSFLDDNDKKELEKFTKDKKENIAKKIEEKNILEENEALDFFKEDDDSQIIDSNEYSRKVEVENNTTDKKIKSDIHKRTKIMQQNEKKKESSRKLNKSSSEPESLISKQKESIKKEENPKGDVQASNNVKPDISEEERKTSKEFRIRDLYKDEIKSVKIEKTLELYKFDDNSLDLFNQNKLCKYEITVIYSNFGEQKFIEKMYLYGNISNKGKINCKTINKFKKYINRNQNDELGAWEINKNGDAKFVKYPKELQKKLKEKIRIMKVSEDVKIQLIGEIQIPDKVIENVEYNLKKIRCYINDGNEIKSINVLIDNETIQKLNKDTINKLFDKKTLLRENSGSEDIYIGGINFKNNHRIVDEDLKESIEYFNIIKENAKMGQELDEQEKNAR